MRFTRGHAFAMTIVLAIFAHFASSCQKPIGHSSAFAIPASDPRADLATTFYQIEKEGFSLLGDHMWIDMQPARYLAVFSRPDGDCHACGADLSGIEAEYSDSADIWTVVAESRSFAKTGSWGKAATPVFLRMGPQSSGFILRNGYAWQGTIARSLDIYGVINQRIAELIRLPTLYSVDPDMIATNDAHSVDSGDFASARVSQIIAQGFEIYPLRVEVSAESQSPRAFSAVYGDQATLEFHWKDGRFVRR